MHRIIRISILCILLGLVLEGGCIMATFGKIGATRMLETVPYDAELQWMVNGGYIRTGLHIENITRILAYGGVTENYPKAAAITGQLNNWNDLGSQRYSLDMRLSGTGSKGFTFVFSESRVNASQVASFPSLNKLYSIDFNPVEGKLVFNGTVVKTWTPFELSATERELLFMRRWNNRNIEDTSASTSLFGPCQFYTSEGLARDYIPVRVGQKGYIYDRVHPKGGPYRNGLLPSEGPEFTIGPDKT